MRHQYRRTAVAALVWLMLVWLLSACTPLVREPAAVTAGAGPMEFPYEFYRQAAAQGQPVYRVDAAQSLIAIEVRRAGSLARLGHDHVVASHEVGGFGSPRQGRADLYVELARLTVDEVGLRAEAGFETQPSASDIEGTRANMHDKVLESSQFPFALIAVSGVDAGRRSAPLVVKLTLRGNTRTLQVPAEVDVDAEWLSVAGRFSFEQTDFGITPYSLFGGAIAVRNEVDLRFRIRARRMP
jgi:polyisoprenoid-binding protein YceI